MQGTNLALSKTELLKIIGDFSKNAISDFASSFSLKRNGTKEEIIRRIGDARFITKEEIANFVFNELPKSRMQFQIVESENSLERLSLSNVNFSLLSNMHSLQVSEHNIIQFFVRVNISGLWEYDPNRDDPKNYGENDFEKQAFYIPCMIRKEGQYFIMGSHLLFRNGKKAEVLGKIVYINEILFDFSAFYEEVMRVIEQRLKISPCKVANFTTAVKKLVRDRKIQGTSVACDDRMNHGKNMRKLHRGAPKGFVDYSWYEGHEFFNSDNIYESKWYWTEGTSGTKMPSKYPSLKVNCSLGKIEKGKKTEEGLDWFIDEIIRNN